MTDAATARHGFPFLAAAQAQKELTHNEALALIDLGLAAAVEAVGVNAPPPAPALGQCWLVGDRPTGAWTGAAGAIAGWTDGGWRFLPAREGMVVWAADQALWIGHRGGSWQTGEGRFLSIHVAGQQVVGARQPAVPAPAGGSVIDTEARAALAALIGRLTAHGLIEPG